MFDKKSRKVRPKIKAEKKAAKRDMIARIYGAFSVEDNILLGRYLKPLEHHIFDAINELYHEEFGCDLVTVMKGMNSPDKCKVMRRKWTTFKNPVAIELDCTHFDKHINEILLKLEHSVYLKHYTGVDRDVLFELLRHQLEIDWDAFTDDGFRVVYKTRGGRVSGTVNTALGNITVMTMCFYAYALHLKQLGIRFEYVNEGDDCFFIVEESDYPRIPDVKQFFLQFGLQVRIENVVREFSKIQFCQTSPICIDGTWRLIRLPKAIFFKDLSQLAWKGISVFQKWLGEVGIGGAILNHRVPVLQNLYLRMRTFSSTDKFTPSLVNEIYHSGLTSLSKGMEIDESQRELTSENRYQFYLTTGIHPDTQHVLEEMIDNMTFDFSEGPHEKTPNVSLNTILSTLINDQSK